VGLNPERGDQLVVEAYPFEATLTAEPPFPSPSTPSARIQFIPQWLQELVRSKNFPLLAGIGAGAMLVLAAGLVVIVRRSRKKRRIAAEVAAAALAAAQPKELAPPTAEELQREMEAQIAEQAALKSRQEAEELLKLKLPPVSTQKTEVLTKHISAEIKKDPAFMAQVVRSWLNG